MQRNKEADERPKSHHASLPESEPDSMALGRAPGRQSKHLTVSDKERSWEVMGLTRDLTSNTAALVEHEVIKFAQCVLIQSIDIQLDFSGFRVLFAPKSR